jgi:hypothetical protein
MRTYSVAIVDGGIINIAEASLISYNAPKLVMRLSPNNRDEMNCFAVVPRRIQ